MTPIFSLNWLMKMAVVPDRLSDPESFLKASSMSLA